MLQHISYPRCTMRQNHCVLRISLQLCSGYEGQSSLSNPCCLHLLMLTFILPRFYSSTPSQRSRYVEKQALYQELIFSSNSDPVTVIMAQGCLFYPTLDILASIFPAPIYLLSWSDYCYTHSPSSLLIVLVGRSLVGHHEGSAYRTHLALPTEKTSSRL